MAPPARPANPPRRAKGRRILVVEDDPDMREEVSSALSADGFRVALARDGQEALEQLRCGARPDVIVLDLRLPHMDGWEFRAAQLADPGLASIPVLAMSGDESPQAKAVHADHYLAKPFELRELLSAVHRMLLEAECRRLEARLREAERLTVLGTVAAGIGHEISNPLTYILANLAELESAVGGPEDTSLRNLVQKTREGALRIQTVVATVRSLSRKDDERQQAVDLRVLLETCIAMTRHQIGGKARLRRDLGEAPTVWGNEGRLGQVFINLLANAAQAIPAGVPEAHEIQVRARVAGDQAVVEVSDTGAGIPSEVRARLFEPFFTTRKAGAGTGLGLAISRDIVTEHGGRIEVESAPGQGATFRVMLPLQR
jgi:signal transduction histidine kinase